MEKWEKAQEELKKKVNECEFQDEVYTMVDDIICTNISKIEEELEMTDEDLDDDVTWYDEIMEDMRSVLYKRIGKWLSE
jgi:hypothetical protein